MNPRERLLCSINHKEPDRVPLDLGSTPSSGISAIAYSNLIEYLNITGGHNRIYDVVQHLAQPEDHILDLFNIDVIDIGRVFNTEDDYWYTITLPNGKKAEYSSWFQPALQRDGSFHAYSQSGEYISKMASGATFFDQTVFPYQDGYPNSYNNLSNDMAKVTWSAFVHSPWDHASEADFLFYAERESTIPEKYIK